MVKLKALLAKILAELQTKAPTSAIPGASSTTPVMDGTAATGSETAYARGDHVHPSDTSKLDLAGGEMSGDIDMMDSQIKFRGGTYGAVFGQANGARVYPLATPTQDYDASTKKYVDDHHDATKAGLASPTFTGTPKAPTAAAGTNTTQIATTAFVATALNNRLGTLGGIEYHYFGSTSGASHTFDFGTDAAMFLLICTYTGTYASSRSAVYLCSFASASFGMFKITSVGTEPTITNVATSSSHTITVTAPYAYYRAGIVRFT